ncbi:hypothetical protein O6H91_19G025700 [Diphasiastrum complanatum]|uniref:Uncharacterized protein n=1 Tax=Diphasiastrum complanatum TaxID=34168 RepID=A0ACC2ATM1_DIPCM|nr:hypothetical protein O6H91_19G025700 [Diphasiastrum complanatum]
MLYFLQKIVAFFAKKCRKKILSQKKNCRMFRKKIVIFLHRTISQKNSVAFFAKNYLPQKTFFETFLPSGFFVRNSFFVALFVVFLPLGFSGFRISEFWDFRVFRVFSIFPKF